MDIENNKKIENESEEVIEQNNNKNTILHKHPILIGGTLIGIVFFSLIIYFILGIFNPATEDAYVQASLIQVSPKVSGTIAKIFVANNQKVKIGDPLIQIDSSDYELLLDKARLEYKIAKKYEILAKKQMERATAGVNKATSNLNFNQEMAKRYTYLYNQKAGSKQMMQKFINDRNMSVTDLAQANILYNQATVKHLMVAAKVALAKVGIKHAKLTNSYTLIRSPVNGYVSDMSLQVGQLVGQGQRIFGLVDDSKWWVEANFKESQINRIKVGQNVDITLDMYSRFHHIKGKVDSISHASGGTFSLLPSQNASGNWVKSTQRFGIRVSIKNDDKYPLRVGASAYAKVATLRSGNV